MFIHDICLLLHSTFAIAKNRNLVAVPLYELYDNHVHYGPIISGALYLNTKTHTQTDRQTDRHTHHNHVHYGPIISGAQYINTTDRQTGRQTDRQTHTTTTCTMAPLFQVPLFQVYLNTHRERDRQTHTHIHDNHVHYRPIIPGALYINTHTHTHTHTHTIAP
jgi:hypothetical protein